MKLKEMLEKRAAIFEEMKYVNNRADDNGSLDEKDELRFNELNTEYDQLTKDIEVEEGNQARNSKIEALERQMSQSRGTKTAGKTDEMLENPAFRDNPRASKEYRDAFWKVYRARRGGMHGIEEIRALKLGDDEKGGYLAPAEFETEVISKFREENVMRRLATVMTSSSDRRIPVERDLPAFAYIAEEGTYPETDSKWGIMAMGAWKLGGIIKVSEELLADNYFNLPGYLAEQMGQAGGETEENKFIIGTGVEEPEGVLIGAQRGKEGASANDFTADELIETYHSLHRRFREMASWMFNDSTALALRKKKDGKGQYLWQPGIQAGEPDRILGRPVAISENMPDIGSSNKPILFGAMRYYRIMDRVGLSIQRLDELYAASGQIGFKGYIRNDGKLLRPDAVKYFQNGS